MKKILLLIICVTTVTLNAQVWTEYFENATAGMLLEDYNDWYVSFKAADALGVSPVIADETLFYTGYAGSNIGKVAILDTLIGKTDATKRISTHVVLIEGDTLRPTIGGKMYAAFLCNILANSYDSWRDFFDWEKSTTSSSTRGRVFAKMADNNADFQFGVSKNSSSEITESELFVDGINTYFLLVLVYESIEGDNNDVISLYINPDLTKTEAEQTNVLVSIDNQDDYSVTQEIKINLRQRAIGAKIGGIRVGTDWDQVLLGTGDNTAVNDLDVSNIRISSYGNTIITSGPGSLQVFDISGRNVLNHITNGRMETSLGSGIYIVRFEDKNGRAATGKVCLNVE